MKDRFKFRYNNNNKIYDVSAIDFTRSRGEIVSLDKMETLMCKLDLNNLIQCTGKKDKNNNLIFEGDILKETYFSGDTDSLTSCLYKVEFDKDVSAFCFTELDGGYKNYLCNFDYKPEDYEIIGNIYKNLELLNEVE